MSPPGAVQLYKTCPVEVTLDTPTLQNGRMGDRRAKRRGIQRLSAYRGHDRNGVRMLLAKRGIELIIPRWKHNTIATHQDPRKLRGYRHQWIVERTNAWLQNFRCLVICYERSEIIFRGFDPSYARVNHPQKGFGVTCRHPVHHLAFSADFSHPFPDLTSSMSCSTGGDSV